MAQILKNGVFVEFGQEQIPYTISKVKDETLDSCKIVLNNFEKKPLNPSTIMYLSDSDYWYVNRDKTISRSKGQVTHNIELVELTQIFNDRFVEDCSFGHSSYTLKEAMDRLFILSKTNDITIVYPDGFENKRINQFVFKDTSLFNACVSIFKSVGKYPRLKYIPSNEKPITLIFDDLNANRDIVHNFSEIEDIEITRELSRNSNASTVISNIYNATSNEWLWYPNELFGKMLYPQNYGLTLNQGEEAEFLLPNGIKDLYRVRLFPKFKITTTIQDVNGVGLASKTYETYGNASSFIDDLEKTLKNYAEHTEFINAQYKSTYLSNLNTIITELKKIDSFSPYIDLFDGQISYIKGYKDGEQMLYNEYSVLEKKRYDLLVHKYVFDSIIADKKEKTIYWEQGENYIKGFDQTVYLNVGNIFNYNILGKLGSGFPDGLQVIISADVSKDDVRMSVNYLPIDDLKISVKNGTRDFEITKQFNQSSTMVDFGRATKDLQNYIDEMESKDIIINSIHTSYDSIYNVGTVLRDDEENIDYIITNSSINVNGNNLYSVIYQLNEEHTRRSEFVTADSDIRDYDIPLNNIVLRKKVFSNQIEFSYEDKGATNRKNSAFKNLFVKTNTSTNSYTLAMFKMTYKDGSIEYYTTPITYYVSFNSNGAYLSVKIDDNYLIGQTKFTTYTYENTIKPILDKINIRDWFSMSQTTYTPIRYTDLDGEIKDIELILCIGDNLGENNLGIATMALPFGNINVQDEYGNAQSLYDAMQLSTNRIYLKMSNFLKDRYEKLHIGYGVYYRGDNDIEIGQDVVSSISNEALGEVRDDCFVRLYDKNTYPYITEEIYNKIKNNYSIEPRIDNVALGLGVSITFSENIDLSKYNIVICNGGGSMLLALNNNKYGNTDKIQVYTYVYEY